MAETNSWHIQTRGFAPIAGIRRHIPDMPLVLWMVLLSLAMGLGGGLGADALITTFNAGFGRALGEFALILLPSFALAAALSRAEIATDGAGRAFALAAPGAGAGMICPDTAYAALGPAAGRRKLDVAFGAYTGFKLLYPAGPLIVATGLGIGEASLALWGIALAIPVWAAGVIWGRAMQRRFVPRSNAQDKTNPLDRYEPRRSILITFAPFLLLAGLLVIGGITGGGPSGGAVPLIDFLLQPKGALLAAAGLALAQLPHTERRACLDSAVRRTGSLLLVIGAASAFGTVSLTVIPLDGFLPEGSGFALLLGLFGLTVLFKLVQGSSMATFAAIAPVTAPLVAASGVDPIAAIYAICLGSFIAILPNDSFYWLVRRDALEHVSSEIRAITVLAGGAVLQAFVGMTLLLLTVTVLS